MKTLRPITLTNSMTHKKEGLKTLEPGKLKMYSCGPTVYGLIHVGNLRAALTADVFFRLFRWAGYEVTYIRNYTDVDDKIIHKANDEGTTAEAVAKKYIQEVEKDYALAGLLEPSRKTTVTEHMPEIISMIEKIIDNKRAYLIPEAEGSAEVEFSIDAFSEYGKLSRKNLDELQAGARVGINAKKKNPGDFALWKPAKVGEPAWDSPWGKGRPGWHIECSAMATKWFGPQMDVHHGGEDLIFPHHENEIAQSEAASGKTPYVGYWVHNGMLTLSKEKMSKSLGNVFLAREFLAQYSGEVARMLLLSVHYRSTLDFSEDSLQQALQFLQRLYEAKKSAEEMLKPRRAVPDQRAEAAWGSFLANLEKQETEIISHFSNDLNTPGALGAFFTLVRDWNATLQIPLANATPGSAIAADQFLRIIREHLGAVLGVGLQSPETILKKLNDIRAGLAERHGVQKLSDDVILKKIAERAEAKKNREFSKADAIRNELLSHGVVLKDSPQGTTWEYK